MFELLALGMLLLVGLLVVGLVGGLLKLLFWLKVLFGVLLLPLFLVLGLLALAGIGIVAVLGLLGPLLPLVVAGLVVWGLVKFFSRPAAATRA